MGKGFDNLVDIVKNQVYPDEVCRDLVAGSTKETYEMHIKSYLEKILRKAALFEFPLNAEDIFPRTGKEATDYRQYLSNYMAFSEEYDRALIMPYNVTAIEDKVGVVIFEHIKDNQYKVIISNNVEQEGIKMNSVYIGDVRLIKPDINIGFYNGIAPLHSMHFVDGNRFSTPYSSEQAKLQDIASAVISFIEQDIYIMDKENFIIQSESNASRKQTEREINKKGKANRILRKTIMRPHYVCLSEGETKSFLQDCARGPIPAHPVIGYDKTLRSERFKKMRGKMIHVDQYFTGQGRVEGKNGITYQVMIKEGPNKIVPYDKATKR